MRAILDANVLLRGIFWNGGPAYAILQAWERREFELVTSTAQMAELDRVARRPQLKRKMQIPNEPDETLERLWLAAAPVVISRPYPPFDRDPKDAYLLAMLRDGRVDYLVTEDQDLLSLGSYADARIVRIREFLDVLKDSRPSP